MIINHLTELFLIIYICIIVHEMGHAVAAAVIGVRVKSIQIGDDLFAVRVGKLSVSLNPIFGSCVRFCEDELRTKCRWQKVFFFLSGAAVNAVTGVIGIAVFEKNSLYGGAFVWTSLYCIVTSMMPWCPWNSDMKQLRRFL